jgi:serine/threonine protein kinase
VCKRGGGDGKEEQVLEQDEELRLMKQIPPHPNIVRFYGVAVGAAEAMSQVLSREANDHAKQHKQRRSSLDMLTSSRIGRGQVVTWLVMELVESGNLHDLLFMIGKRLSLAQRVKMAAGVALGLHCLHTSSPPILHRDVKSTNVLVTERLQPKLCDFGLAKFQQNKIDEHHAFVGTPSFIAPEIIQGRTPGAGAQGGNDSAGRRDQFTTKADVYSFAIVLWQILTLQVPYEGLHYSQVLFSVVNRGLRPGEAGRPLGCAPDLPSDIEGILQTLVTSCWHQDPLMRPDLQEVVALLAQIEPVLAEAAAGASD